MRQFRWMMSLSLVAALTACGERDKAAEAGLEGSGSGADAASEEGSSAVPVGRPIAAIPGAGEGSGSLIGEAWTAAPFAADDLVAQHPFLAANPWSNIHNDGAMSDSYTSAGPLGRAPQLQSASLQGDCATMAFRGDGLLATVCIGLTGTKLQLVEPSGLTLLASLALPSRPGPVDFSNFGGGGYFFLDEQERAVIPAIDGRVWIVEAVEAAGLWSWRVVTKVATDAVLPAGDTLQSALPDSGGRLWFVSQQGLVGFVAPPYAAEGAAIETLALGEEVANSFAVGNDGSVFVATTAALYRLEAVAGQPAVIWREGYDNSGIVKPSQVSAGTGTTPTLMAGGYVAITDNADPMQVVVMRQAADAAVRVVCEVAVFEAGGSATENSLIAAGRSLFVENNYGYTGPTFGEVGPTSLGGFARVDVNADGGGCTKVWENRTVAAPSVVAKVSKATGLLYTFVRPAGDEAGHNWSWAALRVDTGAVVWEVPAGSGTFVNNHYAGLALGPDGAAYLGTLGGFLRLSDGR